MSEVQRHQPGTPSWVDVATTDVDAAADFYASLFGWEASEPGDPEETGGYRIFTLRGKAVAGIGPAQSEQQPAAWTTYVTVGDADATAKAVTEAGGSVVAEPMDVMTAGRMAVFADPAGATFACWQPNEHIGAELVNEPGALAWNELRSRDPETAKRFYSALFGWEPGAFEAMDGYTIWMLGGTGPEHGVGGMIEMSEMFPPEVPPHWDTVFAVDDADVTAERCGELGGEVVAAPVDTPVGRLTALRDPTGAAFTAIKLAQRPG